jgi:XTP/dITP diphosphohydrolase
MKLVVATSNPGKVRELAALLDVDGIELVGLSDFPAMPPVAETGSTYLENARLKAVAAARHTGLPALADDSGLEVDALGGAPGVRSARFAADHERGEGDRANLELLLERLRDTPDAKRTARFRCVIAVATPGGHELVAEGTCDGVITRAARGEGGFGYDPVFYYPPANATFAEIPPSEKQRVSHRANACQHLRENLADFLKPAPSSRLPAPSN